MIGFMRNNIFLLLLTAVLTISSCNIPVHTSNPIKTKPTISVLWDLNRFSVQETSLNNIPATQAANIPTSTPQLIKAINFEEAFSNSYSGANETSFYSNGNQGSDRSEWLYFSPADYSSNPLDTLYTAFKNTGDSTWTQDYFLEFYAGANPSNVSKIPLEKVVHHGEEALFQIPIITQESNWKACWELKNAAGNTFYEFCYNHGNGTNTANSAQNTNQDAQNNDVYFAFVKTNGSAPARFSDDELSAEFLSSSPGSGHTFQAYDHFENLTVNFQNNGTASWDSSYALKFYSGYNWMHSNSFPVSGSIQPGEIASITMPMEIIEDNDNWISCWYLSSPDGKNLADFCFEYHTRS